MKQDIRLRLSKKIRLLRKRRRYTQEQLAELTGLDYKYVQKIESKHPPDLRLNTLERLAKALKVPAWKLLL